VLVTACRPEAMEDEGMSELRVTSYGLRVAGGERRKVLQCTSAQGGGDGLRCTVHGLRCTGQRVASCAREDAGNHKHQIPNKLQCLNHPNLEPELGNLNLCNRCNLWMVLSGAWWSSGLVVECTSERVMNDER